MASQKKNMTEYNRRNTDIKAYTGKGSPAAKYFMSTLVNKASTLTCDNGICSSDEGHRREGW